MTSPLSSATASSPVPTCKNPRADTRRRASRGTCGSAASHRMTHACVDARPHSDAVVVAVEAGEVAGQAARIVAFVQVHRAEWAAAGGAGVTAATVAARGAGPALALAAARITGTGTRASTVCRTAARSTHTCHDGVGCCGVGAGADEAAALANGPRRRIAAAWEEVPPEAEPYVLGRVQQRRIKDDADPARRGGTRRVCKGEAERPQRRARGLTHSRVRNRRL